MKTEKEIAKDIKALAKKYAGESNGATEILYLKRTIDYMVGVVLEQINHEQSLLDEAKENDLTLTQLEAEGFIRACLTIKEEFYNWDDKLSAVVKEKEANYE